MQKIAVTYLASLILFQGMFSYVNIIFEIGEVLEDYQLHKVKYGDDLATFMSKHFGGLKEEHKEQHKKEHKEHKHPIQSDINNLQEVYICNKIELVLNVNFKNITTVNNFNYKDLFSTFEKQKIFQPPRLA